jgi:hypothetical protein
MNRRKQKGVFQQNLPGGDDRASAPKQSFAHTRQVESRLSKTFSVCMLYIKKDVLVQLVEHLCGLQRRQRRSATFYDYLILFKIQFGCQKTSQRVALNSIHYAELERVRAQHRIPIIKLALSSTTRRSQCPKNSSQAKKCQSLESTKSRTMGILRRTK